MDLGCFLDSGDNVTAATLVFFREPGLKVLSPRSDLLSWVGDHPKNVSHFWATRVEVETRCSYTHLFLHFFMLRLDHLNLA